MLTGGAMNTRNNCYLNSIAQCLIHGDFPLLGEYSLSAKLGGK